ncbi:MAG: hypothetical protein Q8K46_01590 [Deltaproteobacteria bacterium]|nr:hypothetical protein [Deltaproteobacteria bacterium]
MLAYTDKDQGHKGHYKFGPNRVEVKDQSSKAEYYLALNKTQRTWKNENEDVSPWLLYIFDVFLKQAKAAQSIFESDQFEYLLSQKQLEFWQWAQRLGHKEFNRRDAIKALGFPPRTIEQIMKKFLDMKKLDQLGRGRATRYRVIQ